MFYPSEPDELRTMISLYLTEASPDQSYSKIIGVVVPHAGYVYSGATAAYSYKSIAKDRRRRFVIVGPKHSGYPWDTCIYPDGLWKTPLGLAPIDMPGAKEMLGENSGVSSYDGHEDEHSIEVQVPWLQYLFGPEMKFVPVSMGDQSIERARNVANGLSKIWRRFLVVASSDLTHYESSEAVNRKDFEAIKAIEELDVDGFYRVLQRERISACGYGPIASLMLLTKKLGGKMQLLHHSNSGDVSGDHSSVVGYPSIIAYLP